HQRKVVDRLETVESDRHTVEIEDRVRAWHGLLRRLWFGCPQDGGRGGRTGANGLFRRDRFRFGSLGRCAAFIACAAAAPILTQLPDGTDDAARQEECDRDEQTAKREQPKFRIGSREPRLCVVDEYGADDRAEKRAAPADRRPD